MSELPEGWQTLRLGDVSARTSNVDPSQSPAEEFELYSVPSFAERRPELAAGADIKSAKQGVQPDDVLLCKIVPHINRVWVVGAKSDRRQIASGEWIVYRDHGCDPHYLRYCLTEQSFRDRFMQTVAGVGGSLMRARPSEVAEIEVPLPPLPEQRRIVAKIDSLTSKSRRARDHLDHIPHLIGKYKQAVLAAAFAGGFRGTSANHVQTFGVRKALDKLYQEHLAQKTISSEAVPEALFQLPPHWCWATAETLVEPGAEIVYGIVQPGPKLTSGIPYVRGTDIENGRIKVDQLLFTSAEIAARYERASLRGGDILLGIIRATKVAVVPEELAGGNITQGTARFRPSALIRTSFLARWLESSQAQSWLHSKYRGIDMPGLNLRDVRQLPVPLPPLDEQHFIETSIERAFAWIDRLASEATSARRLIDRLDQAVLAKAFRGELVSQDPADEPASVLLERIRAERTATPKKRRSQVVI